jgi:hypothetical protein
MLITIISCKSKAQNNAEELKNKIDKTVKENSPANTDDKQKTGSPGIPQDMKSILGEWTLFKRLRDDNGNHKIDEDEEKAVIESKNYMKLNADGSCKYETIMDGRYEIVTGEDGRKKLDFYDMSGTKFPTNLYIMSVNENELMININQGGGSQFEIYKRP